MTREEAIEELTAIKSAYTDKAFHEARLMRSEEQAKILLLGLWELADIRRNEVLSEVRGGNGDN